MKNQEYQKLGDLQAYKDALREVELNMNQWEEKEKMKMFEMIVHAAGIIKTAEKTGIIKFYLKHH